VVIESRIVLHSPVKGSPEPTSPVASPRVEPLPLEEEKKSEVKLDAKLDTIQESHDPPKGEEVEAFLDLPFKQIENVEGPLPLGEAKQAEVERQPSQPSHPSVFSHTLGSTIH